jgi:hypothetical protein
VGLFSVQPGQGSGLDIPIESAILGLFQSKEDYHHGNDAGI